MQLALYRAERPEVFDDIIGQKQIVKILQNQIKNGSVSQAYLFTGTHGTGKTSTARILAKAVNCIGEDAASGKTDGIIPCGECENCKAIKEGRFVDVIELDAASNNGVDDLRAIIDLVKYPPTIGKYKVYIIDEVHMLTQAAENAFLKTLEEPPEYAIFILATTDPQKVRATIRSRCMQLNFKRVSEDELVEGMERICRRKNIEVTRDALGTIASKADGSVRDALSILEQCMAAGDKYIDKALVLEYTGSAGEDFYLRLTDNIAAGRLGEALCDIDDIIREGKDAKQVLKDWLEHYRNLMITKYVEKASRIISASSENIERIQQQAASIDIKEIERGIRLMSEYINLGRYSDRPRILLETLAVRLVSGDAELVPETRRPVPQPQPQRMAAAVRPAPAAPAPASRQEPQDEEPITMFTAPAQDEADLEADLQLARATSPSGDAQDMWNRICREMTRIQPSFSIIARSSQAKNYDGDELLVYVKKNKHSVAEQSAQEIDRLAKGMFGARVYVKMVPGDVDAKRDYVPAPVMGREEVMPEVPEEEFEEMPLEMLDEDMSAMNESISFDAITSNLADSLGMNIKVIED
ncbi:MAG: DNA polymerase III subunit gamma/tau [Clostridiales bacterium]|nr:DNA polymerase III subunit gamma/tau [Candidatus Crickella merdequi]